MEKRLIVAIALSLLIIVGFQYFFVKPQPQQKPPVEEALPKALEPVKEEISSQIKPGVEEKTVEAETDNYIITFSNFGGAIKSIKLKKYKNSHSSEPLELVALNNPKDYIGATAGQVDSLILDQSGYEISVKDLTVTASLKEGDIEVVKKYILHKSNYSIELQIFIKNATTAQKTLNYNLIGCAGLSETSPEDKRFLENSAKVSGKISGFKKVKTGRTILPGSVEWIAGKNKYFSIIMIPSMPTADAFCGESAKGYFASGVGVSEVSIPPKSFVEHKFSLYAGPAQIAIMKRHNPILEETINYGFFGGIAKVFIVTLEVLHKMFNSWGFAIIVLAVVLNIILFPLSMKSFQSMKKMQELHPQMEKLKIQCKDNPQKLNKEMMELYKKYKINPFSGCLPLLLQMPIFIALYQALSRDINLRSANFLWIKDLSSPDAVPIPFTLPIFGNSINVLPLAMVAAMVIQQKISTKTMGSAVTDEQKQQQKMMLIMMPILFGFIFYNMPSGLVLYWLINTVLTAVEQVMAFKNS